MVIHMYQIRIRIETQIHIRANPTVMVIQECSKQSFRPHHREGVGTPPMDFFFLLTILLGKC
jgi:hypothetical protein